MNVVYFIAAHMEMEFKLKPIDVKAEESINEKTGKAAIILDDSESCHLRFLFFLSLTLFCFKSNAIISCNG
jgi:hypothetical protein